MEEYRFLCTQVEKFILKKKVILSKIKFRFKRHKPSVTLVYILDKSPCLLSLF